MTQEQKAKAYDEALKYARYLINERCKEGTDGSFHRADLQKMFPELQESEDESIRKEIISALKYANHKGVYDKHLAWLEKKGEQKPIETRTIGYWNVQEMITPEESLDISSEEWNKIENECIFSDDKPKFKVGDWIIRSAEGFKHNTYLIKEVKDYYVCEELKGRRVTFTFNDVHKNFKLWDIQDTKNGDVLSYRNGQWIFILKRIIDKDSFEYYTLWSTIYNDLTINDSAFSLLINSIYPATKEERDLLFQKMKENGYEWDAEKKELKKIKLNEWVPKRGDVCRPKKGGNNIILCEQDGIVFRFVEEMKNGYAGGEISILTLLKDYELVEPKDYNTFDISFSANDSELQEASYNIPKGFHAEINGNKVVIKKGERFNNEERDSFIELCNDLQMRSTNESLYDELEKLKNWIKSL